MDLSQVQEKEKKRKEKDVSTKTLGVGYSVKKEIYGEIYNVQECV